MPALPTDLVHVLLMACTCMAGLTFGPITLGGWVMSGAWLLFILVSMVMFRDPLKAQKQREAAEKDKNKDSPNDRCNEARSSWRLACLMHVVSSCSACCDARQPVCLPVCLVGIEKA